MSTHAQILMYEFDSGELIWTYDPDGPNAGFSFSSDGKQMAVWYENQVDLVDCESGTAVCTIVTNDIK